MGEREKEIDIFHQLVHSQMVTLARAGGPGNSQEPGVSSRYSRWVQCCFSTFINRVLVHS